MFIGHAAALMYSVPVCRLGGVCTRYAQQQCYESYPPRSALDRPLCFMSDDLRFADLPRSTTTTYVRTSIVRFRVLGLPGSCVLGATSTYTAAAAACCCVLAAPPM